MEKVKEYKFLIILAILILGFGFYWFEIRITQIKKECFEEGVNLLEKGLNLSLNEHYTNCLRRHGL